MSTVSKSQAEIDAFVADLRKTKGGVSVTESDGETVIRTRDGDEHRFKVSKSKKAD
ncbi:hypothetical protein [Tropicimonas isoalkanivorans]|uniref:Uncharacterized protein n=1 Tax=Tropicimonas isoalkanivorans TaxID=441112 RepID=A0A1I1EBM1_9RHOB|nr:hypothetical protein [Tropicimonas isoalkanivorans]SFB82380.1 hypothetical protein SAMN04488094_101650 [Tropicimonas isoalkanivorans]